MLKPDWELAWFSAGEGGRLAPRKQISSNQQISGNQQIFFFNHKNIKFSFKFEKPLFVWSQAAGDTENINKKTFQLPTNQVQEGGVNFIRAQKWH